MESFQKPGNGALIIKQIVSSAYPECFLLIQVIQVIQVYKYTSIMWCNTASAYLIQDGAKNRNKDRNAACIPPHKRDFYIYNIFPIYILQW